VSKKKKLILFAGLIIFAVVLIFVLNRKPSDKIHANTYIHGVAVGGLTAPEANAVLMEFWQPNLAIQTVAYTINGEIVAEFTFADFGLQYDFSGLIQKAMDDNLRGVFERMIGQKRLILDEIGFTVIHEQAMSVFSALSRQVDVMPTNASFAMIDGQIIVSAETKGHGLDVQAAAVATENVLRSRGCGTVELMLHTIEPKHTAADFDFTVSVLGSFRTKYTGDETDPRIYNIRLASDRINNQVLFPGDVFSAGALIAAHKPNSGYKPAIVLVSGEPKEDIGGGVCQVVTTLYNAVLVAELPITQRHNHSAPVSYVDSGFDATVAGDYYDLKFKNNTEHPILIVSQLKNEELVISVHGLESRPQERSVRFSARKVKTLSPDPCREVVDAAVPKGKRHVVLEPQEGFHIELLKHVYMNGKEVETVKINTSIYKPLRGVVAIGAGE